MLLKSKFFEQILAHIGTISISYGPGAEDAFCLQLEKFSLDNLGKLACMSLINFLSKEAKYMTLKLPLLVYMQERSQFRYVMHQMYHVGSFSIFCFNLAFYCGLIPL